MTNGTQQAGGKTILIVEDDQFLTKAYQIKFKAEGFDVWIATDGQQALSYLSKQPPQAVLLDLMLPQVSGFDVLAAIRNSPQWKRVPVIIMSNLGQQQDIDRGKALGISDYIVKANVKINDVVERVRKLLGE